MSAWIKVETTILRKREVFLLARALQITRHQAVGLCVAFWAWADHETEDGYLPGLRPADIDAIVEHEGFGAAMATEEIGWLEADDGGLLIPNWQRHHGSSAKRRALDQKRKFQWRKEASGV